MHYNIDALHFILHFINPHFSALHYTTLHHTTPHCTTLHHTAPHCTLPDHAHDLHLVRSRLLHRREDLKGAAEVPGDAVVQHSELSLRGEEVQGARRLELVQLHTLVEVAVIQHHRTISIALSCESSQVA
jgi:hypothetical protein